jgi:hypothetical protein
MGYNTRYKIKTEGKPLGENELKEIEQLEKEAEGLSGKLKRIALDALADKRKRDLNDSPEDIISKVVGYDPFEDECKWYDHDEHMRQVSKANPETIFILEGEGEESGDIWKKYYLNGKRQEAKAIITFEPFDEKKLK